MHVEDAAQAALRCLLARSTCRRAYRMRAGAAGGASVGHFLVGAPLSRQSESDCRSLFSCAVSLSTFKNPTPYLRALASPIP